MLGAEGAGVYFLAATIVSISTILGRAGLDNSLLRFVSAAACQNDWSSVAAIYKAGIRFAAVVSFIISIVVIGSASFIARTIFSEPLLTTPLTILAMSIAPMSLLYLHGELLKSIRKISAAVCVQAVFVPVLATALLVQLVFRFGVVGAASATTIASVLVFFVATLLWHRAMPAGVIPTPSFDTSELRKVSAPLFIVGLMNILIDFSDTVMIGLFEDSAQVGIYTIALRITGLCSLVLTAVNSVVAPEFSALWAEKNLPALQHIARRTTLSMAALATTLLLLFFCFTDLLLTLFGSDFSSGKTPLRILAIGQFIALGTGPVAYLLMMTGHEKFHRNNVIASAGLNILLNAFLIPIIGITGAAIATAISLTLKNGIAVLYVRSKLQIKVLL